MRQWVIKVSRENTYTILFGTIYTNFEEAKTASNKLNELHKSLNYHYSLIELVEVEPIKIENMSEEELSQRNKEILEINNDLEKIIDYDEWSAREYGEDRVDYYGTAINLYNAGYRKVKEETQ